MARSALRAGLAAAAGAGTALLTLWVDRTVGMDLPVASEQAESLLIALLGALVTLAAFALWMRSVVVGLTATQISPRILMAHLEDRYQWRLLHGMVAAICFLAVALLMLDTGRTGTPALTVLVSPVLVVGGLVALLVSLRAGVNRLAPDRLVRTFADWALEIMQSDGTPNDAWPDCASPLPGVLGDRVRTEEFGWVVAVDRCRLLGALPRGSHLALCVDVGSYASLDDTLALCDTWLGNEGRQAIRDAITIHPNRSSDHDLGSSLQQLRDLAGRALGPDMHDTSTAHEAMRHLGTVLSVLVQRAEPSGHLVRGDRAVTSADRVQVHDHLVSTLAPLVVASRDDPVGSRALRDLIQRVGEAAVDNRDLQDPQAVRDVLASLLADVDDQIARSPLSTLTTRA